MWVSLFLQLLILFWTCYNLDLLNFANISESKSDWLIFAKIEAMILLSKIENQG